MRIKAEAYNQYNQAAVLDKLLTGLPEMVRALAEPLSKVDRVTIVSTGSDGQNSGVGASRLTGDLINMLAQVPALFEMLSGGVKLEDLMGRIPGLHPEQNGSAPTPEPAKPEAAAPAAGTIVDVTPVAAPDAQNANAAPRSSNRPRQQG